MDPRIPYAEGGTGGRAFGGKATAHGPRLIVKGMPTSLGIVLAIISGLALGVAVLGQYFTSRRVDEAHDAWMAAIAQEHLARGEQHDALMLQFRATQTACTLTERRLLDIQAYAILNNWAIPTDAEHGPLGNLERMKPREAVNARQ